MLSSMHGHRVKPLVVTPLALICVTILIACSGTAKKRYVEESVQVGHTNVVRVLGGEPPIIPAEIVGGVAASFHLQYYAAETTRLIGYVTLTNLTDQTVAFGVFRAFFLHLEVRDNNGKEAISRVGAINPAVTVLQLPPSQRVKHGFDIIMREGFILPPGDYRVRFKYDLRMVRKLEPGEDPIVPWSSRAMLLPVVW